MESLEGGPRAPLGPQSPLSFPAKAGNPVLRGGHWFRQFPLRSTGSPAFAGDDLREFMYTEVGIEVSY
ncbi:hypothetical protein DAA51_36420 [Bradyrhizobium sp. WBAH10]|nr:hypothetical protein [Bradyrhizobium sp. WBAH30]MDD1543515.1 hypothetical protein [Bradyrhizobium sp. WBAH41]MDD1557645.1 hypothetical protein [Bradyrhizobium sp. WBAH23]MDD1565058.1 hypothetical protein [Bradyrhizobium sp. WBAH33]MDD1590465.1 hypothetical protein [Bradyrhizobium sp. WBAH42]NRB88170.1 hypothetical protein [Bradyrhizobium sp. WBAH10]QCJ93371.1 hypothetical protein DAA57_36665 [Bradyrhizobium yuanmingense]